MTAVCDEISPRSPFSHGWYATTAAPSLGWGISALKRAIIAIIGLLAACRLLGRRQGPGTAGHVSRHGATPAPRSIRQAAAIMISQYRQNNGLGMRCGRSRTDQAGRAAVAGDGRAATSSTTTSRRRSTSGSTPSGYPATVAVENVSAGYHTLAEAFSGWRDSPPHKANMLKNGVTKLGIAASLCSEHQIQGVLDAHSGIDLKRDKLGVILASISPIDAAANWPPRCRSLVPI